MSLAKIVRQVAQQTHQRQEDALPTVKAVFEAIKTLLQARDTCAIVGFGRFVVKQRKERQGRNPKTGERILIRASDVPTFLPTPTLKEAVNNEKKTKAKKSRAKRSKG